MGDWMRPQNVKHTVKQAVNTALLPLGIQVVGLHDRTDVSTFIPLEETLAGARRAGLSVGDYIDTVMSKTPGATQNTIDQIAALGVFSGQAQSVVEIGPGSGRYLEKTMKRCSPSHYEVYETSAPWAAYVAREYGVLVQPTDGCSLHPTATESVDLAQAHKVFSTIPFIETCRYWPEMARVTKPNGYVVFDIVTEDWSNYESFRIWAESSVPNCSSYPAVMPRRVAVDYFERVGFTLVGTFLAPMGPGRTEVFVFKKQAGMIAH
jgi:SAM-dependent methyltransferase